MSVESTATRRASILMAAAHLFARQGIAETSVRQVAQRTNISNGTLHYHFPSKSDLIQSVIAEAISGLRDEAMPILEAPCDPRRQLRALASLFFAAFDRDWNRYHVALLLGDELRATRPDEFPTCSDLFVTLVRQGQRGGQLRSGDPVLLGILCHGMVLRTARGRAFGEIKRPLTSHARHVADACWRVLKKSER